MRNFGKTLTMIEMLPSGKPCIVYVPTADRARQLRQLIAKYRPDARATVRTPLQLVKSDTARAWCIEGWWS